MHLVDGFNWRTEMREEANWRRTFRLWSVQLKDPRAVTYEQFMGRAPILTPEEKKEALWEHIQRDRELAEPKVTERPDGTTPS